MYKDNSCLIHVYGDSFGFKNKSYGKRKEQTTLEKEFMEWQEWIICRNYAGRRESYVKPAAWHSALRKETELLNQELEPARGY